MLPTRLLSYRRSEDGAIHPTWLGARDEVWLRELVAEAEASAERRSDDADERILERVAPLAHRHGSARRVVEAVWTIERRRWKSRVDAPLPPERIREVVFDLAVGRTREDCLALAATKLGIAVDAIVPALFADRAGARRLVPPEAPSSPASLVELYNLALAQALLARSSALVALVRANMRAVIGYAKLHRLMASFDENAEGVTRVSISGPLALFHDTLKYGRALATWLPSLIATPGWSLVARVVLGDETLRLALDGNSPLPRTHAMARAHDSKLEARFEKDLRRLSTSWSIIREGGAVRIGPRTFYPDFVLVSGETRVLVEVVGFWTPEYLAEKAVLLRGATVPIVLCVDERHARGEFVADPRVVLFRKTIDAAAVVAACELAVVAACERALVASPPEPSHPLATAPVRPTHHVVIAPMAAVKHHAVRAGARAERWREEVFEDLTRGSQLRLAARAPHDRYGPQIGIVGERFYAEANRHDRRGDALFIHHVTTVARRPAGPLRLVEAQCRLLDVAAAPSAARADPVASLFEQAP